MWNPIKGFKNFIAKVVVFVIENSEIELDPQTKGMKIKIKKEF